MELAFSPSEQAFRTEVREFLSANLPEDLSTRERGALYFDRTDCSRWQQILNERGWAAPGWPEEFGGPGWTPAQRYIFEEECAAADAPVLMPMGVTMVGPVIYTFGTETQRRRYLPKILSAEEWWCQGYSEPGSGSDLASLATRAVDKGDHYLVTGQKIWTTMAHVADWMFCLVRTATDVKAQEGISFLLIDMRTPGVTVEPIILMDDQHTLNQVFFEDVVVPKENRIGEENKGWTYAKFLLGHERTGIAGVARSKKKVEKLRRIAAAEASCGDTLANDPDFQRRLAELEIDLSALEYTELRMLSQESAGKAPGPEASTLKIRGTEIQQSLADLTVEALGNYAVPFERIVLRDGRNEPTIGPAYAAGVVEHHLHGRAASIYGGSNEIQRNILAKMVLGL